MDKKLVKAFNEQIKDELYSAYLYLSMAAYFDSRNLAGFSHWMKVQFREETAHAMKIFDFLADRGVRVALEAIEQPTKDFSSIQEVFSLTLGHEKKVTALIGKLYALAKESDDSAAAVFLQWFINEQVEEEKSATAILETIKMSKSDPAAIIILDRELAKRQ